MLPYAVLFLKERASNKATVDIVPWRSWSDHGATPIDQKIFGGQIMHQQQFVYASAERRWSWCQIHSVVPWRTQPRSKIMIRHVWPAGVLGIGFVVTIAWIGLIAYMLATLASTLL